MGFNLFKARGGGNDASSFYSPFQAIVSLAKSGIGAGNFQGKCPCDTQTQNYTSSYFFTNDSSFPKVSTSGDLAVSIFSGSMLYSKYSFDNAGHTGIKSYVGPTQADFSKVNCEEEKKGAVMRVYGLNKPIFIKDFFTTTNQSDTLKIWLTVCFPTGQEEASQEEFNSTDKSNVTCVDCEERANVPLTAFISVGIQKWPELVQHKLINKGSEIKPRLEKRQVAANIPIAEIDSKGTVLKQFVNANLMLQDMCLQGIPCKMPLSIFSEYG